MLYNNVIQQCYTAYKTIKNPFLGGLLKDNGFYMYATVFHYANDSSVEYRYIYS